MPTESDPDPSEPAAPEASYAMCVSYHEELNRLAYEDKLAVFDGPASWRRHLVHDLYHSLRSQGDDHQLAISGILKALPHMHLDENEEAYFL